MSDIALSADAPSSPLATEVARRRTFAIISHPDAGKTTLTEKLLLFGGAINLAGQVKAKGERRNTRSDWMKIERDRGISVVTSVMTFEFDGLVFNLLDTPGHEDFSEDTYRTLTAVDSAVMVIDAAKGIEARTRKLFEVCRLRDIPIITFINKMDRETRDPFELLDEIEKTLALDTTPITWPVGRGRDFIGTYDILTGGVRLLEGGGAKTGSAEQIAISELAARNSNLDAAAIEEELALVTEACKPFDLAAFREGHLTPVFFGSALRNFGVGDLLEGLGRYAPPPRAQESNLRKVEADEPRMSAFVFKIQANMDPNHRDRIAFARLCSGKLQRGMKAKLTRTGKPMSLSSPQFFFAQDRALADEAFAGDVVGIPNHGTLRIGDTLTEGEDITFVGVPSFAPEILRRVRLTDAMKAKKLKEALQQMSEEGVVQVFRPRDGSPALVGVVGQLQLDVLKARLDAEYGLPVDFEISEFSLARWFSADDRKVYDAFVNANGSGIAEDVDGDLVFLAKNQFYLDYTRERSEGIRFANVKDVKKAS
ncbi:peptide chain release factor 3 [Bradyrhizobium sp. U87765 SZCCT0131]|uniref:peptide chain release factor 3 n=1 Tax=unclassified Bradyrhizobium TaxID=2631580 RepID=UPI001BADB5FF|nr:MULTISPECIES: peptide chain release factor 3 [unclassified Bradyrhizobium]MBR1220546.1 peptide chain release factor 3 [Bradyrhizobium sp. U87765 SZCCT0131]MBR1262999.1 peptide chain release factor 3 [Bradyrhizobium sp. U87765 SZCCT0134]MBR1307118.1 peptide chain release factor 3 [Bradyrhizobium sp. U87765 SZCCT0110]MBR1322994.1 peptide chain release factor 3 [Bradyrhizobium sp. U87765 SZCCT0109]MBR1346072.1 peptide chain release factor 3 [Bradyrhizobium sp. U87765 SZCCT0048]